MLLGCFTRFLALSNTLMSIYQSPDTLVDFNLFSWGKGFVSSDFLFSFVSLLSCKTLNFFLHHSIAQRLFNHLLPSFLLSQNLCIWKTDPSNAIYLKSLPSSLPSDVSGHFPTIYSLKKKSPLPDEGSRLANWTVLPAVLFSLPCFSGQKATWEGGAGPERKRPA